MNPFKLINGFIEMHAIQKRSYTPIVGHTVFPLHETATSDQHWSDVCIMSPMENTGSYSGGAEDGRTPQQQTAQRRLQQTQAQVEEVVGIMRVNVEKVLERDQKLSELDNRADALQQGASQFEQRAGQLKRKYWWKNLKMMIIMGVIGLVLLIIIIVWITSSLKGDDSTSTTKPPIASSTAGPS